MFHSLALSLWRFVIPPIQPRRHILPETSASIQRAAQCHEDSSTALDLSSNSPISPTTRINSWQSNLHTSFDDLLVTPATPTPPHLSAKKGKRKLTQSPPHSPLNNINSKRRKMDSPFDRDEKTRWTVSLRGRGLPRRTRSARPKPVHADELHQALKRTRLTTEPLWGDVQLQENAKQSEGEEEEEVDGEVDAGHEDDEAGEEEDNIGESDEELDGPADEDADIGVEWFGNEDDMNLMAALHEDEVATDGDDEMDVDIDEEELENGSEGGESDDGSDEDYYLTDEQLSPITDEPFTPPNKDADGDLTFDDAVEYLVDDEEDANESFSIHRRPAPWTPNKHAEVQADIAGRLQHIDQLATEGWSHSDLILYQILSLRGLVAMLPLAYKDSLPLNLPLELFTSNEGADAPFIRGLKIGYAGDHGWRILDDFLRSAYRFRSSSPQAAGRDFCQSKWLMLYLRNAGRWALKDAGLWHKRSLRPAVLVIVSGAADSVADTLLLRTIHKLEALEAKWIERLSGLNMAPPPLYAITVAGLNIVISSYVPDGTSRFTHGKLRSLCYFDYGDVAMDVWNALAVMALVCHCRNTLLEVVRHPNFDEWKMEPEEEIDIDL